MFSTATLLALLIVSTLFMLIKGLLTLGKNRTWIKTRTRKMPMEEIGFLLYGDNGDASCVYVSGGSGKTPIGRVIIGDGSDENAYVEILTSDYEDETDNPKYRTCGYITPEGIIYKKLSPKKKAEIIGFTARPSAPNVPTTLGERSWKSLWLKSTLNVYLGIPPTADQSDQSEAVNAKSKTKKQPPKPVGKLVGTCSRKGLKSAANYHIAPEARACAFSVFYNLYNKSDYTEYYRSHPYGWKDTALISAFIYSVAFIIWFLTVRYVLNERFIGYKVWLVPGVTSIYFILWYVIRLIKIDFIENGRPIQSKIDLLNKSLNQGVFDTMILVCAGITAAFTLRFYRFDFLPLVAVMITGVSTNMSLKSSRRRWRIDTGDKPSDADDMQSEEEVRNPDGDITRNYEWELDKEYGSQIDLKGDLTLYFTEQLVTTLRHSNPFYVQRKERTTRDYIREMFRKMREHHDLTARLRYVSKYIDTRTDTVAVNADPPAKVQFIVDFIQAPNIAYVPNNECSEIDMFADYIRWPEETLYDKAADCNSKALLAAMLFHYQKRNVLYMYSKNQEHAAIGIEIDPEWEKMEICGKPVKECIKIYGGRKYLFCEVTVDGIAVGGLIQGMDYDDFDDCLELPLVDPEIDDANPVDGNYSRTYFWDLDSEMGNRLSGTITLDFDKNELADLRSKNPFLTYGSDGRSYEQNIESMFKYLKDNPHRRSHVKEIADYIRETVRSERLPELDMVQFTLDFAQAPNIHYCIDEESAGINFAKEYMRFPDEVLFDQEGDCDCKSSLTAALFNELGYSVLLMISSKLQHAAIGVECSPEWLNSVQNTDLSKVVREHNGKKYIFCETTGDGFRVGHIADESSIMDFESVVELRP